MTKIEWTEKIWNPIVGCSIVSPGCTNCYAMKMAARLEVMSKTQFPHYAGTTRRSNGGPVWTGKVALASEATLLQPLRRQKPSSYFVNSMGDLFHEDVPDEWIDRVFAVMALCPQHTFQVLTKRSTRMRAYCRKVSWHDKLPIGRIIGNSIEAPEASVRAARTAVLNWPLPNVWLGVSAERQQEANARIPDLLATPAAVRFVSAEPLLGPIDFTSIRGVNRCSPPTNCRACSGDANFAHADTYLHGLNWIIVGGESGPGARPMHPEWARSIRDQCDAAGVPFFFKQWGEWGQVSARDMLAGLPGIICSLAPNGDRIDDAAVGVMGGAATPMIRRGKSRAGRRLDGCENNDMPPQAQRAEAAA